MYKITKALNVNGQIILSGETKTFSKSLAIKTYNAIKKKVMSDLAKELNIETSISEDSYCFNAKIIDTKSNTLKALKIELNELC